jgi:putative nucleotidyltransferase with HDIG domain
MLGAVSIERMRDEFLKLLQTGKPDRGLISMAATGLLIVILPEIAALENVQQSAPHREPVLAHTVSVLHWLVIIEQIIAGDRPADYPHLIELEKMLTPYMTGLREHLGRDVDGALDGRLLLRLGALFHDAGKATTQNIETDGRIRFFDHDQVGAAMAGRRLRRLRLSNEAVKHVMRIVSGHMRPLYLANEPQVSRRAVYRFYRATHSAGLDIGLLALADHLATYGGVGDDSKAIESWQRLLWVVERLFDPYFQRFEENIRPVPLVNGLELIEALELEPGPEIGRLLSLIEESQAAGEISTREEALSLAARNQG